MPTLHTERLTLRPWTRADLPQLTTLCSDEEVMKHFPNTLSEEETERLLQRLTDSYEQRGYTYFACERKDTGAFIGFIGLLYQDYDSPCTPNVDIGWRLMSDAWGHGFATEGAKACLDFAFNTLKIDKVVSVCPETNAGSEKVMQRIGMTKGGAFKHPKLDAFPKIQTCLWYAIEPSDLTIQGK
ncbi:MAG: GNAT family N-acetyltransferase [Saprospiraceae bacterium]